MDSAPPPPPPAPPAYVYAATDERPRTPEEQKLCAKASDVDWLYLGTGVLLTAGAIALDTYERTNAPKQWGAAEQEGFRLLGPAGVGLTWGFTLGGGYLALPKCSPDYVSAPPPEGNVRTNWEIAIIFAALAGVTAPILVAVESGTDLPKWDNGERVTRLVLASAFGIGGALIPYVLPPKTWRAAKELERLRASPTAEGHGGFVSWSVRF